MLRAVFHFATLFSFVALLVSYGLAGPQAVWQTVSPSAVLSAPPAIVFLFYWLIGTVCVVVFLDLLLPVFGSFTVLKGALFAAVILIVALLPASVRVTTLAALFSDFSGLSRAAAPFLMSCVALGGLPNTCPVTFALLPRSPTRAQVRRFRLAIVVALVICYLLNVGWVVAVVLVVPRTADANMPSLALAYERGQISTVPLIAALNNGGAVARALLRAVDMILELFILVSTGVSYFVISAGLKSFIDGFATDCAPLDPYVGATARRWCAYVLSFGSILFIILSDPAGFISALTRFSSLMLNFQAGVLVFLMLFFCRRRAAYTPIPTHSLTQSANGFYDSVGGPSKLVVPEAMLKDPEAATTVAPARPALELAQWQATSLVVFGVPFFGLACLLAAFGPMLGIKLGAHE